jgi:hypothetical protein
MKRVTQSLENLFDWNLGLSDQEKHGGWDSPFDPRGSSNNFTEG